MDRIALFAMAGLLVGGVVGGTAHAQKESAGMVDAPSGVKCIKGKVSCVPAESCGAAKVHFAFDSAALNDESKEALDCSASCLKANQSLKVTIEGATDDLGSSAYNKNLGQRRAEAVSTYLIGQGVSNLQLGTVSLGEDHPICTAKNDSCRARNRRAQVVPAAPMALR